jgi:hypothetical protein
LLVSAARMNGRTAWFQLSLAYGAAQTQAATVVTDLPGPYATQPADVHISVAPNGDLQLTVARGQPVLVYSQAGPLPPFELAPLPGSELLL